MRIIDLTLPIDNDMPGVTISTAKTIEDNGWNATTLSLYSHSGTHMDAPRHFLPEGKTLDEQDLPVVVGTAHIIDLTPIEPKQLLTIDLFERYQDKIQPGARLLLRSDWHRKYGTSDYRNALPRIS